MTTIITRLYEQESTATTVMDALRAEGFPGSTLDQISGGADAQARVQAAGVTEANAAAYAAHMDSGNTLVVVRAPFSPLGAARRAMEIVDGHASVDAGAPNPNEYIRVTPDPKFYTSIMEDHPLFLTWRRDPAAPRSGTVSASLGFETLSAHKDTNSVMSKGGPVTTRFLPIPLISKKSRSTSAMSGGKLMTPGPHLRSGTRKRSVRRGGGFPFSEIFGMKMLSDR